MTHSDEFTQDGQSQSKNYSKKIEPAEDSDMSERFRPHFASRPAQHVKSFQLEIYTQSLSQDVNCGNPRKELAANQIEQLVRETSKSVVLFEGDCEDTRDYILYRCVDYSSMVGLDPERIQQAFSCKDLYFYLYENRTGEHGPEFWARLVDEFAAPKA